MTDPNATLPANQTGIAPLSPGQTLVFDAAVPWNFSGSAPFTVAMWVRLEEDFSPYRALFSAQEQFTIAVEENRLFATFGSGFPAYATPSLAADHWYHLAVVYDPNAEGGNTLTIYVDAVPSASVVVGPTGSENASPVVANDEAGNFTLWRLSYWSIALDGDQVHQLRFNAPSPGMTGLEAAWEFAQVPVVDGSGNNRTVAFEGGARQVVVTPALVLQDQAYAVPTTAINPSAGSFTIQTWFQFADPASSDVQYLFATAPGASTVNLSVQPLPDDGTFSVTFTVGGRGGGKTGLTLELDRWYNLAATFDAASGDIVLYLDGTLLNHGTLAPVAADPDPQPTVGAQPSGDGFRGYFQGQIQNVAVWPMVLDAEAIAARRYPTPIGETNPLALYDFAIPPGRDLITGEAVALEGGATLTDLPIATANLQGGPTAQLERARVDPKIDPAFLARFESTRTSGFFDAAATAENPAFSVEAEAAQLDAVLGAMPQGVLDGHTLANARRLARENLSSAFEAARNGALTLDGVIRHEVIDGHYVWFHHTAKRATPVMAVSTAELDDCTAWMIDMGATAFFGILTIIGVPITPGAISSILEKLLKKSKVALAFANVLAETITVNTYIDLVKALYDTDYLTTFGLDILDTLSWYDYLFFAGELLIELGALLFPGAELTIMLAKLALVVAQLIAVASQCPAGCID